MSAGEGQQQAALFSPEDLACPVCVETIEDAFATPCGHTFCFKCISTHLRNKSTCPSCGSHLVQDQIHPNHLLSKLIQRAAAAQRSQSLKTALLQHVQHDLAAAGPGIGLQELDAAIQLLQEKRQQVATHETSNKLQLLMLFLQHAKARQEGKLSDLEQQLDVLQQDLARARGAATAAAATQPATGLLPQQQQQHQQLLAGSSMVGGAGGQQDMAAAVVQAAAAAQGSRSTTPTGLPQQQQQAPAAAPAAAAAAAAVPAVGRGSQQLGGPGSAFRPLQVSAMQQPVAQQPALQQQLQPPTHQQQQGFRPLTNLLQQQQAQQAPLPTQGFRPLPKPQQQQQQQGAAGAGAQRGFRPFTPQQQQGSGTLQNPTHQLDQQSQQPQPQQQQQQGFRPLPQSQGAPAAAEGLNSDKKRKILAQFDELQQAYLSSRMRRSGSTPLTATAAAAAAGAGAAGAAAAGAAVAGEGAGGDGAEQQQQQQQWGMSGDALLGGRSNQQAESARQPAAPEEQQQVLGQPPAAAAAGVNAGATAAGGGGGAVAAAAPGTAAAEGTGAAAGALDAFSRMLYAVTHFSKLERQAYAPPINSSSAGGSSGRGGGSSGARILSSAEFDCAGQLFAVAGVQQRIFVHDFASVLKHGGPPQQQQQQQQQGGRTAATSPAASGGGGSGSSSGVGNGGSGSSSSKLAPLLDLHTGSKVSCLSFSPAVQQYLLSSDYAGTVQLWDLTGGRTVRQWEAHDKRIWAVDFCPLDATSFATGSDDATVKVWGLCEPPVPRLTLPVRANVCSIKFSPAAPHILAAGSAGHQVHIFDLRSPRTPLAVLKGHNKAVSYVRWAGPDALVTASTDSTLRLWTASGGRGSSDSGAGGQQWQGGQAGGAGAAGAAGAAAGAAAAAGGGWDGDEGGWHCSQEFRGHANTKHFVGLATQGPFIACGSETNEVYVYHQGLPQPSLRCMLAPWSDSSSACSSDGGVADRGTGGGSAAAAAAQADAAATGAAGAAAAAVASTAAAAAAAGACAPAAAAKSPFVSALCWKKDSDVLLAANSTGGVWVLAMQ